MSIFQTIKEWIFGKETAPADSILSSEQTLVSNTKTSYEMGSLKGQVSSEQFASFFDNFTKGIEYIEHKYKVEAPAIRLTDDHGIMALSPRYDAKTQTIYLPRTFIKNQIEAPYTRQGKTEPFILPSNDMTIMYGIEEAYHHAEYMKDPDRYLQLLKSRKIQAGQAGYDDQPIEREARDVVRAAMKELDIINDAYVATENVRPEDLHWINPESDKIKPEGINVFPEMVQGNCATKKMEHGCGCD